MMVDSLPEAIPAPPPPRPNPYQLAFRRIDLKLCNWCAGVLSDCLCQTDCGRPQCPRALDPEPPMPPVPVMAGPCDNCKSAPATTRRRGYRCCQACADQADLPAYLRET